MHSRYNTTLYTLHPKVYSTAYRNPPRGGPIVYPSPDATSNTPCHKNKCITLTIIMKQHMRALHACALTPKFHTSEDTVHKIIFCPPPPPNDLKQKWPHIRSNAQTVSTSDENGGSESLCCKA